MLLAASWAEGSGAASEGECQHWEEEEGTMSEGQGVPGLVLLLLPWGQLHQAGGLAVWAALAAWWVVSWQWEAAWP